MMKSSSLGSNRPLSGQLYKYTNVVKGWQQRWFSVDPETGVLSYYLFDGPGDTIQPGQPARGEAHLAGAGICPSDEDSRTFTINCASGDMLKLRATDARARQEWVNGLRAIAEIHTKAMGANPPLQPREQLAVHDAMASARQQLQATEMSDAALARIIEAADSPFPHTDPDLLLLKATSAASMQCLLQCLGILLRQQQYATLVDVEWKRALMDSDTPAPSSMLNVFELLTRACYDNYCDYYKCNRLLGEVDDCKIFKKYFQTICPNFWIEHWDELREKGAFPGPI